MYTGCLLKLCKISNVLLNIYIFILSTSQGPLKLRIHSRIWQTNYGVLWIIVNFNFTANLKFRKLIPLVTSLNAFIQISPRFFVPS